MKANHLISIALLAATLFSFTHPAQAVQPGSPLSGNITGTVTTQDSGLPLANVSVRLRKYSTYGYSDQYAGTQIDGTFSFGVASELPGSGGDIPAVRYRILFDPESNSNYLPEWYDNQPLEGNGAFITITEGITTSNINAALSRGAIVTGSITTSDNSALPFASASLLDESGAYVSTALIDPSGIYTHTRLRTGAYTMRFFAPGYIEQFYSGKQDRFSANTLTVTAPNTVGNINAVLHPGGRITGTVTASDTGLPLANVSVSAYGPNGGSLVSTDAEGRYAFSGLPSGNYRLFFGRISLYDYGAKKYVGEFYNNRPNDPFTPDVVSVVAPNTVSNINAALDPGGTVVGRFVAADTGEVVSRVASYFRGCEPPIESDLFYDGFRLEGLPSGALSLGLFSYTGYTPPTPYITPPSPVVNVTPANTTTITITVQRGGQIIGNVVNENNRPVDVFVIAGSNGGGSSAYSISGTFTIRGMPSGTHSLSVYPEGSPRGNYSTTFPVAMPIVTAPLTASVGTIVLQRAGAISGQLKMQDTDMPIVGAGVSATRISDGFASGGRTDGSGNYAIWGLQPGSYRVRFNLPSTNGYGYYQSNGGAYVPQFYNGQSDASSATPVIVPSSLVTVTEINASLQRGGRIAGKVVDVHGIAVPGVLVTVFDSTDAEVLNVRTQGDSTYLTSPGLPAGQYRVRFSHTACNGQAYGTVFYRAVSLAARAPTQADGTGAALPEATPVNVSVDQTARVDIALPAESSRITGRVTRNGTGLSGFKLTLSNATEATTDASGIYTFTGAAAGTFTLAPSPDMSSTTPATRTITAPPDAAGQDFAINESPPPPPVLSQITGRVTRNGVGISGFKLTVSNGAQATTDPSGSYAIGDLAPGNYTISPASGMPHTTPASRAVSVPPSASDVDFVVGSRATLPLIVRRE